MRLAIGVVQFLLPFLSVFDGLERRRASFAQVVVRIIQMFHHEVNVLWNIGHTTVAHVGQINLLSGGCVCSSLLHGVGVRGRSRESSGKEGREGVPQEGGWRDREVKDQYAFLRRDGFNLDRLAIRLHWTENLIISQSGRRKADPESPKQLDN